MRGAFLAACLLAFFAGCKKEQPDLEREDQIIQPVYPADVAAVPLAVRFCKAVQTLPAENEARCCNKKGALTIVTDECVRNLSSALTSKALDLAEEVVARCEKAMAANHSDCTWTGGPWTAPIPAECQDVFRGTLGRGDKCRSTLECKDNLRCAGGGPTGAGVCAKPSPAGSTCSASVDPLVVYTRQENIEEKRPECEGWCYRKRCVPFAAIGESCDTNAACGPSSRCSGGKCVEGELGAAGDACADGGCAPPNKCVLGKCTALKAEGEACSSPFECKAACIMSSTAAVSGVCGKQCRPRVLGG